MFVGFRADRETMDGAETVKRRVWDGVTFAVDANFVVQSSSGLIRSFDRSLDLMDGSYFFANKIIRPIGFLRIT